jgi:general secretion pathway protein G
MLMYKNKSYSRQRGFTLLELLVVLVILGMLAGLVGPKVMKYLGGAKSDSAKLQIQNLGEVLDMYKLGVGRYPTTDEGLDALVTQPSGVSNWTGPYIKKLPKDPWGHDYQYKSPGEHGEFDIYSLGADNTEGGTGEAKDTTSWE